MNLSLLSLVLVALSAAAADDNPVFKELTEQGVATSDGATFKLRAPILPDGLDVAGGQLAAITKEADARTSVDDLMEDAYRAPVMIKIRTIKKPQGTGPTVRGVDVWFVAHGDWNTLVSKDFLQSADEKKGTSQIVLKAGVLTAEELQKRKLSAAITDGREERLIYTTFVLFERVEVSATRFSVVTKGKDSILVAGKLDTRFDHDAEYPNRWRPLLRDASAEITRGPARPLTHAAGYAKLTRLVKPAKAVFVEFHMIYEEPYGWFDGVNLVKQKVPAMVQEMVRKFRRKLATASEEQTDKSEKP
jgi:hypothetical protein